MWVESYGIGEWHRLPPENYSSGLGVMNRRRVNSILKSQNDIVSGVYVTLGHLGWLATNHLLPQGLAPEYYWMSGLWGDTPTESRKRYTNRPTVGDTLTGLDIAQLVINRHASWHCEGPLRGVCEWSFVNLSWYISGLYTSQPYSL